FGDLFVFLWLRFLDIRAKLSGNRGNLIKEGEFALVKAFVWAGKTSNEMIHDFVQSWLDRVRLNLGLGITILYPGDRKTHNLGILILVRVCLHIPNDLVSKQL